MIINIWHLIKISSVLIIMIAKWHIDLLKWLFSSSERAKLYFTKEMLNAGGFNNDSTYYLYSGRSETRNGQGKKWVCHG